MRTRKSRASGRLSRAFHGFHGLSPTPHHSKTVQSRSCGRMQPVPLKTLHMPNSYRVFIDESRQTSERFMVLGGIITTVQNLPNIQTKINAFRANTGMVREFKWTKTSRTMLINYQGLVDLLVDFINQKAVHFKAVVFDSNTFDHKKFSDGDEEKTFYKMMYQFILHKFGDYLNNEDKAVIHLDQRTTSYSLNEFKSILNSGIRKKYELQCYPIRSLEPLDSKESDLIQIADVIMGAIGYEMNQCHCIPGASPAKCRLANHIASQFGLRDLRAATPWGRKDFEIWHFRFNAKS